MQKTFAPRTAIVIILAVLGAAACGRGIVPLNPTTPVLLESQADPAELRAAIIRALEARRYTTEAEEPGSIVARLQNRGVMLRLRFDYTSTDYRITYLESTGLDHRLDPNGNPVISRRYDGWVAQLQRTIDDEIGRPAREAAEVAEQQRQHELAVLEEQRNRERDQREFEAREAERDRRAQVEQQRLRTEQARAEAEARRPIIVNHDAYVVDAMIQQPRQRVRSRFATVQVDARVRMRWLEGQAEGDIDSSSLGLPQSCRGFYAGTPEHVVRIRRDVEYLRLETDAEGDPTLMLVAEDGSVYCDDDGGNGLNSRIEGSFPPGSYRVYVGSYQPGRSTPYRLLLTAERAEAEQPAVVVREAPRRGPAAPAAPADCRSLVVEMGHSPAQMMHCQGAEPYCAEALLRAGHSPAQLMHCQGVDPTCAVTTLRAGHSPAQLLHCR